MSLLHKEYCKTCTMMIEFQRVEDYKQKVRKTVERSMPCQCSREGHIGGYRLCPRCFVLQELGLKGD